ncbi:Cytochrome P450 4c3 [Orchesella cincta]|uniref:Cytochrome P450 4c3 n=1 Tax=Orchesella cincta TaxID=48709 RepID=A0A1D2M2N9_ORCCI|nr:Cytochrome P450 4c3 [Orchesella cincta]
MGIARIGASIIQIPMLWNLHPASRKYNKFVQNFNLAIQRVIARYEEVSGFEEKISKDNENDDSNDSMLALMSNAGFSREVIADEIKTMLGAGYETTSTTVELLLVMLALYPKYQNECRQEVDAIFNNDIKCPSGKLTLETLSEMKHLERCLFETMRMYPAGPIVGRKLETALKINNELEIPVGTTVGIPIVLLHRCPKNFPEPDQFQPDRFLAENCIKRHPIRTCRFQRVLGVALVPEIRFLFLAMKLAIMEAKTLVAYILREFEVETSDKIEDVTHIPSITVQLERGYYFRFKKRMDVPAGV